MVWRGKLGTNTLWGRVPHDKAAYPGMGRRFPAGSRPADFEIFAPGLYTVEGAGAIIDGRHLNADEVVILARGVHRFEPLQPGEARLRWGRMLARPKAPFIGGPVFQDF